jgi:glycosyltransferase involved in cell wall biosynthesis
MRIAWFRDTDADTTDPLDSTAAVIDELRATHEIDIVIEASAHDFVWQHIRRPWDLCVFELDNLRAHQFMWGYVPNYPGVVLLHSIDVPNLRVAMIASRAAVVGDRELADSLQTRFPDANVRYAPSCGPGMSAPHDTEGNQHVASGADASLARRSREAAEAAGPRPVRFAVFDERPRGRTLIDRAFQRARHAGVSFEIIEPDASARVLSRCDVVIAPGWPPFHARSTALLAAMAAGKSVVTTETGAMAEWSAIDPQTWRPRDLLVNEPPIAITIDPRDEEHSLMLAIRRLSADAPLRDQLGRAARAWWETHATPQRAATAWLAILQEALTLAPPSRPPDWSQQFREDGTDLAREILDEFGVRSDVSKPQSSHE